MTRQIHNLFSLPLNAPRNEGEDKISGGVAHQGYCQWSCPEDIIEA